MTLPTWARFCLRSVLMGAAYIVKRDKEKFKNIPKGKFYLFDWVCSQVLTMFGFWILMMLFAASAPPEKKTEVSNYVR